MTRTSLIALSALTALTIAACGSQGDSARSAKVVATASVWGSVATAVAGGHADVKAILTKLDAISRTEAVAVAHKRGLIHL